MKRDGSGIGCLLGLAVLVLFPLAVLRELVKMTK